MVEKIKFTKKEDEFMSVLVGIPELGLKRNLETSGDYKAMAEAVQIALMDKEVAVTFEFDMTQKLDLTNKLLYAHYQLKALGS